MGYGTWISNGLHVLSDISLEKLNELYGDKLYEDSIMDKWHTCTPCEDWEHIKIEGINGSYTTAIIPDFDSDTRIENQKYAQAICCYHTGVGEIIPATEYCDANKLEEFFSEPDWLEMKKYFEDNGISYEIKITTLFHMG